MILFQAFAATGLIKAFKSNETREHRDLWLYRKLACSEKEVQEGGDRGSPEWGGDPGY